MATKSEALNYHHGDLHQQAIAAGLQLAHQSGPQAVGIREVARQLAVSPTALYRHFTDLPGFFLAVQFVALQQLADYMALRVDFQTQPTISATHKQLVGLANAYLDFALEEPGLFRTALDKQYLNPETNQQDPEALMMLLTVIEALSDFGVLAPSDIMPTVVSIWASMHGFAILLIDGYLDDYSQNQKQQLRRHHIEIMIKAIT